MTPEQLRDAYNRYIDERKQSYVAKMTNINASTENLIFTRNFMNDLKHF